MFAALADQLRGANVAVIGLGAGELASYATPGQHWTFFEIDPVVETIARERFTFLPRAAAPLQVVLGDGRLELSRTTTPFDLLVIDAFLATPSEGYTVSQVSAMYPGSHHDGYQQQERRRKSHDQTDLLCQDHYRSTPNVLCPQSLCGRRQLCENR